MKTCSPLGAALFAAASTVCLATAAQGQPALLELTPGNYTAVVRGKNGHSEVGLIEVYNLP